MRAWNRIGVIGAGNMGSGIAQKIATEGFPVVMVDVSAEAARAGIERIRGVLAEGIERKLFSQEQADEILGRLEATHDFSQLAGCDLVIEAVFEDKGVKRDVFGRAAAAVSDDAILATNTSSFRVTDLAEGIPGGARFLGLHYFYHPAKNRLVEVVPGAATDARSFEDAWRFQEMIGKTPIRSADSPGFIVNRYFVPWLNEAVRILDEGVADIATIEAAAKESFAIGMGPFELMNVTGVPIALHAATTLGEELGPFYAPSERLAAQVESKATWPLEGEPAAPGERAAVASRLRAVVYMVAGQMLDEGVCTIEDCDIGARVGLRWSRGPFELMNEEGIGAAAECVRALADRWQLALPATLATQVETGQPFAMRLVDLQVADGIATVRINRPDAMNALNPEVVAQLAACFDEAAARDDVRTIVLAGAGKAFVAGADIKYFVDKLDADRFQDIFDFTARGQALLHRIDECPKRVICKLDGLSLGGGSELALCADVIVATDRASMGFPETGIGIYPGLGGTQRTTRRVGPGLAKFLVYSGQTLDAKSAAEIGLVDEVVPAAALEERIVELAGGAEVPARPALAGRWHALGEFFSGHTLAELAALDQSSIDPSLAKIVKRLGFKAPVAMRLAETCIDRGVMDGIDAGLQCELAHLSDVFGSQDAREGLGSVLEGRRPAFQGK